MGEVLPVVGDKVHAAAVVDIEEDAVRDSGRERDRGCPRLRDVAGRSREVDILAIETSENGSLVRSTRTKPTRPIPAWWSAVAVTVRPVIVGAKFVIAASATASISASCGVVCMTTIRRACSSFPGKHRLANVP